MKKQLLIIASVSISTLSSLSQTTSDFENLPLDSGSYWTGASASGDSTFHSGNGAFPNSNNGWWASGWAYSNVKDSTTAGYTNNYGSRAGSGYNGSDNYVVGKSNAKVILQGESVSQTVEGAFITNGTYAALSMQNGDNFGKKFGGETGSDPDWFLLTIKGFFGGALTDDSVNFYLADFRFSDNTKDYIIKDWNWVDLTSLGKVDSLVFLLKSSDVGQWGMNTPAYFCMDNLITAGSPVSVFNYNASNVIASPNPTQGVLNVTGLEIGASIQIVDLQGAILLQETVKSTKHIFYLNYLNTGVYLLNVLSNGVLTQEKFIKK